MAKLTQKYQDKFCALACAMSPENISWDGERPKREIARAMRELQAEWAILERKLGRKVSETEAWGF